MDLKKQIEKELCERDFFFFYKWVFENVYRRKFVYNWHIETICKKLQLVTEYKIGNLLITIPPRHYKTEIVSIMLTAWGYVKNKQCNNILTSYSSELALKNSAGVQTIIRSRAFQDNWPLQFNKKVEAKSDWQIEGGGATRAAAAGGAITGFGAGVRKSEEWAGALIVDDPLKAKDERFDLARETVNENFENTLTSRLNDEKTPIIIIMQRLHENDLAGHVLSGRSVASEFIHLNLPALNEDGPSEDDPREKDEPLDKTRFSTLVLKSMEKKNPSLFAGQYQQRPAPVEGNMVKKDHLKFYKTLPKLKHRVISCDLNFKKDGSSYACLSYYGVASPNIYLIKQIVGKWSFIEAVAILKNFISEVGNYSAILIEDKANGPAMISTLEDEGFHSIIPIAVDTSKVYRLSEVSLLYAGGNVYYPDRDIEPWVEHHVMEMLTFPNAKNDDRVDAETQMLKYYKEELSSVTFYDI